MYHPITLPDFLKYDSVMFSCEILVMFLDSFISPFENKQALCPFCKSQYIIKRTDLELNALNSSRINLLCTFQILVIFMHN